MRGRVQRDILNDIFHTVYHDIRGLIEDELLNQYAFSTRECHTQIYSDQIMHYEFCNELLGSSISVNP